MLKMLKSPCICTTFSRFNIFDEKLLKKLEMLKFSIFLYKKLSPAAPVTPPYSMYYIFRVWRKLKSLRNNCILTILSAQMFLTFFNLNRDFYFLKAKMRCIFWYSFRCIYCSKFLCRLFLQRFWILKRMASP